MKTGLSKIKTGSINARTILCFILLSIIHFSASAQDNTVQAESSTIFANPLFIALLAIIVLLLIVILVFADVVKAAAFHKGQQEREKREKENTSAINKTLLVLIAFGLGSGTLFAQEDAPAVVMQTDNSYWGLDGFTFYTMVLMIALEIGVAWFLYNLSMQLLGTKERKLKLAEEKAKIKAVVKQPSIIEKLNASVAIEEEADIMLDHNYDGIRELDNNLPPWWKYGFYATIVFSFVYLIHYHVSNTGKLQLGELEDQLTQAKHDMEEYHKKAANLVDESNATALTDEASLSSGKNIFMDNCAACHGRAGEGGVGPNLTDDYWLHQGGVKDIFKTIKYGWPEKGMKAWQQDLGAKQIHEVTSFILSLHGTNPPNPKEKQGDFYKAQSDSTTVTVKDSTQIVLKEN